MNDEVLDLVTRWRQGDQAAAKGLFDRYVARLMELVRSRLSAKLAQRIDPEDVVQSAYRSFFAGARQGHFELRQGGDLWRLLVATTLHKLHDQVKRHQAARRSVQAEEPRGATDGAAGAAASREPSPLEAAAVVDTLEAVMRQLEPAERRMLELRLQGYNLDEIGVEVRCSRQTVRRVLERVVSQLERL
ncbi:MAG: sigma-70 family RNA polymerase sigma factor [Planctomycetia bacterium]|nr:sigma-70 family RNA polymerase sigma factor [Planctomycetia bacterium]